MALFFRSNSQDLSPGARVASLHPSVGRVAGAHATNPHGGSICREDISNTAG